jgi:hypothetical protein
MTRKVVAREPGRAGGHGKRRHGEPRGAAVAIAERRRALHREGLEADLGEGAGDRQQPGIVLDHALHGGRGIYLEVAALAQQDHPESVVELRVGEKHAFHRHVTHAGRLPSGQSGELGMDVGRRIEQKPAPPIGAHGRRRLAARMRPARVPPRGAAGGAPAVPLGESAARGGPEQDDLHPERVRGPLSRAPHRWSFALQRRDVGGDFHRDGHDLGLGLGPRH